jgi:hypothetical protein
MQTAEQQLGLALQQNDAQQRMIAHISERLAAMEEAGKIGDEKVQLLTKKTTLGGLRASRCHSPSRIPEDAFQPPQV